MFSPIGGPKKTEEPEIDWGDDLKFYIDNDSDLLANHLFPAIMKHQQFHGRPDAYKFYIKPLEHCCEDYCAKFDINDKNKKFTPEVIIDLAKKIAEEQHKHIEEGQYK